jgi:catechol 2,3-dioxygenase-like lactoylglutathione lyase family enzyme
LAGAWKSIGIGVDDDPGMEIVAVTLGAPADALGALHEFYGAGLGLPADRDGDRLTLAAGAAHLAFAAAPDGERPFYHFALLVPGDRFAAAMDWLSRQAELLPSPDTGDVVFAFDFWDARACYCHDPAGNIVEVIAHADTGAFGATGAFTADELLGISEVGVVTADPQAAVDALARLDLELWSGSVPTGPSGLGFVGRKAHTLIVCAPGRGWIPTGRPAEPHTVDVTLSGGVAAAAALPGAPVCVRRAGASCT